MKKKSTKSQYRQQKKRNITEDKFFDFSKSRKGITVSLIIVFCLPVLLYLQTIKFGFTNFDDDSLISKNIVFLNDFHNAPQVFNTNAFILKGNNFYRPMQTLSYMVDIFLTGGNNTWMYHLTNILLFGVIACLLFLLLRKFLIPVKLAVLGTLIFCVHPLFVSSIAWIPARGDLQLMLFSLLSFLFFIEFLEKRKIKHLLLNWAAFTIALFCKETATFLPLLFIFYYFAFYHKRHLNIFKNEKKYFIYLVFYVFSGILWFWLRSKAVGDFLNQNEALGGFSKNNEVGLIPVMRNLQTLPESLFSFFIPVDIAPMPNFSLFKTLVGLIIIVLISVIFFKNKVRSKKEKIFCFSWFIILLLPTMLYKNAHIDYLNHRFFLPLIGILIFMLFILPLKWFKKNNIKNSWIIIVAIIILSSLTFIKSRSYSDPISFYNSAISQNPNSELAYYNRGVIYNTQGINDKAINDYTKAIELKPDYFEAYNNRGTVYGAKELYDKAINDLNKAIELKPDYSEAYNNRGFAYSLQGLYNKAINDYTKAIELKPCFPDAYNNRGIAYNAQGLFDKAISDYTKAIELNPGHVKAYYNRGTTYENKGLFDNAIIDYTKAIEINIDYAEAYYNRGTTYHRQEKFDKAIADYTKVIELKPDYAETYNNRGVIYHNKGLSDKSCSDFKKAEELGSKAAKDNIIKFCK